jgi:hypothetical protein
MIKPLQKNTLEKRELVLVNHAKTGGLIYVKGDDDEGISSL